jgi:hypothetical protein
LLNEGTDLALRAGAASGQTLVQSSSPLTRLNYFDGKLLRAEDLRREQLYVRQLVQLSNQGLGAGVVYGIDTTIDAQGRLAIGPGLAMDSVGRPLLVASAAAFEVGALIDATRRIATATRGARPLGASAEFGDCIDVTAPPSGVVEGAALYLVCIGHAESLCGTEEVYGRLCEEACITATDRPLIVEGVVVRALPLTLRTPLATSRSVPLGTTHLRSLVASAYFQDERQVVGSLVSRAGLALDVWCVGADAASVGCVPLGVIARSGTTTTFFDAWTARRERIEAPARRYWAWRMAMRPWDVYLAQILQFQCQLHEVLGDGPSDPGNRNPCEPQRQALDDASRYLREFSDSYTRHVEALSRLRDVPAGMDAPDALFRLQGGLADLAKLRANIDGALNEMASGSKTRVLINGGIVELPSAGYLPVVPGTITVNEQVRRLVGEGLDLRFCIVRPDFVPHALEEAQHMERISLLVGLDDPKAKPQVDVLVPDGTLLVQQPPAIAGFDTQLRLLAAVTGEVDAGAPAATLTTSQSRGIVVHGAGRSDRSAGAAFHFAGAQEVESADRVISLAQGVKDFAGGTARKRETLLRSALRTNVSGAPLAREAPISSDVLSRIALRPALAATPARNEPPPKPTVGVWLTMRTERDPFALQAAETTAMSIELALTMQRTSEAGAASHTLLRVRAFATFSVSQAALAGPDGLRMTGRLSGTYTTQAFVEENSASESTKSFDVDAVLRRTGDADSGTLRLELGDASALFQFVGEGSWGGTPLEANVKLTLVPGQKLQEGRMTKPVDVLSASALASADALAEGGLLRVLSTTALGLVGDELTRARQNGSAFVDVATRLLFPPAPAPVDDLLVRPTLDWVLFHRRRTKQCAADVVPPAPTPPRRYQLFTLRVRSPREVDLVKRALESGSDFKPVFQRVDVVEFAGASATLLTAADALLNDWRAVQPGNTLAYAAAATGIADDTAFTASRLGRVVSGVASVSPLDTQSGVVEVLPAVPAVLTSPGLDGVIVLVTLDVARLTYQNLYRVTLDDKSRSVLSKNLIDQLIKMPQTRDLGARAFSVDSSDLVDDDAAALKDAWDKEGGGRPLSVFLYAKPDDDTGGDVTTLVARGRSIADAVGGNADTTVEKHDLEGAWPVGPTSPVIAIVAVAPPPVVRNALVIFASRDGEVHFPRPDAKAARVKFADDVPTDDTLSQLLKSLTPNEPVGGIALAVLKAPADVGADARVQTVVDTLVRIGRPAPRRTNVITLSDRDRTQLERSGHAVDGLDEVIFLEPQPG